MGPNLSSKYLYSYFSIACHRALHDVAAAVVADVDDVAALDDVVLIATETLSRVCQQCYDDLYVVYAWLAEVPCLT